MSDSGKKRTNSFRKLFPSLFFSNKSKEKTNKLSHMGFKKSNLESCSNSNQYENPRIIKENVPITNSDIGRIYENLATEQCHNDIDSSCNTASSHHSSSSTLVSESVKTQMNENHPDLSEEHYDYSARPQVPPKPYNALSSTPSTVTYSDKTQFPDVYYHSVENFIETVTPLQEIQGFTNAKSMAKPASVGAEIKRVSTKILISPKKEAEVRTILPKRARSYSFDNNNKSAVTLDHIPYNNSKKLQDNVMKSYNYSAPTSPIPSSHRIPNMPKTVSPYGHVKKTMNEAEDRRNSLNRTGSQQKPLHTIPKLSVENKSGNQEQKDKARQKLEAFYWQKLKELKQKEDDYLLEQSIHSTFKRSSLKYASNLNYNTSVHQTCKSNSLPRQSEERADSLDKIINTGNPFLRGVTERRTDTFPRFKTSPNDADIVYRHPEKLQSTHNKNSQLRDIVDLQGYPRGSLNSFSLQPKRVSFEERIYDIGPKYTCSLNESPGIEGTSRRLSTNPPLPPVRTTSVGTAKMLHTHKINHPASTHYSMYSESESGSEASEIQRILFCDAQKEDDWHGDGSRNDGGGLSDGEGSRGPARARSSRRDDPRRHTLAGNHLYVHPHHPSQLNSHEMENWAPAGQSPVYAPEYATVNKSRDNKQIRIVDPTAQKPPLGRGYPPPSSAMLFDDDPGIMSEVETASTGFRRGGKQRSSLPVVRTPSKTLERPLGLVFLQYRNETKRALLPNEITSIDTVKALFVRSFPKQLSMQYMDSPMVKIYIHDSSKDMFYELEDVRAHLRDIRDRSVLRLFEATDMGGGVFPGAVGVGSLAMPPGAATCSGPPSWDQDQSYFSEPEIDSEYHHQHVHKTKVKAPAYYMGTAAPSTLPRGGSLLRAFSPAPPVPADRASTLPGAGPTPAKPLRTYTMGSGSERSFPLAPRAARPGDQLYTIPGHGSEGYMSSPERGSARVPYEDPYYTQFLGAGVGRPNITPVIDEETSEGVVIEDAYQMYGVSSVGGAPRPMPRPPYDARLNPQVEDIQRLRVEKMERQLANLTGLVQKALQVPGGGPGAPPPAAPAAAPRQQFQTYQPRPNNQDAARFPGNDRPPKLGRDKFQKSVSFEKSVSFSDDPPDMNSPIQHSPQHSADTKPTKPAIKSSTLPRTSSQERDRLKPAPPPKPAGLVGQQLALVSQKIYTINVTPDFFSDMRVLQKQSRDLRIETRNLRRSTLSHAIQMRQLMADTIVKIGALAASFYERDPESQLTREEEIYRQDMLLLENDLYELEATVERLRGQAANRETRVNMADIERIAMVLSKSSKTVADWKLKFPILQDTMKVKLASEMEKVVRKEKMLEEEPERLELALRRCKKLTGTLVTLKRLACVQEQRLPAADGRVSPGSSQGSSFAAGPSSEEFASDTSSHVIQPSNKDTGSGRGASPRGAAELRPENALDALLDELQTFAKPAERGGRGGGGGEGPLRRLHSYPSGSDTDASPPVRARGQHPPKPPVPERHPELLALAARRAPPPPPPRTTSRSPLASPTSPSSPPNADSSPPDPNLSEDKTAIRQSLLEQRHLELLKKQKALQEQYTRLQMIQRSGPALPPTAQPDLKKTGSESNLLSKMNLNLTTTNISGSMTHLACESEHSKPHCESSSAPDTLATTNKVYETDIL